MGFVSGEKKKIDRIFMGVEEEIVRLGVPGDGKEVEARSWVVCGERKWSGPWRQGFEGSFVGQGSH